MSCVATIDIGTNSVLLLVAEKATDGRIVAVEERATITRLGQGVDKTRELAPEAVERTLVCLRSYAGVLRSHDVRTLRAVGTSAMRDARGGDAFRDAAAALLGTRPEVISGDEEASLTFIGALSGLETASIDLSAPAAEVAVFDIGGGSTEFIRGALGKPPRYAVSLDVGSVRLTERHVALDPPSAGEVEQLEADIDRILERAPDLSGVPMVGTAGTVTTIAAIAFDVDPYDAARVHGARLGARTIREVADRLLKTPLAGRKKIRGLAPDRADVIAAGALLCAKIIERFAAPHLIVSDRGVRWGMVERLLEGEGQEGRDRTI